MHPSLYQEACKAAQYAAIEIENFQADDQFERMHKAIFFGRAYAGDRNSDRFQRLMEYYRKVFPYEIKRAHWQWKLTKCLDINCMDAQELNRVNRIEDRNGIVSLIDQTTRGESLSLDKIQELQKLKEDFDQLTEERRNVYGE
jgi:hypothetical protein